MPRLPLLALVLWTTAVAAQDRTPLPVGVPVVEREAWGAAAPSLPMVPQTPLALTVHHTATPQRPDRDPRESLRALLAFSQSDGPLGDGSPKRPWADVPYHFYVAPDGTVLEARDVAYQGDTNTVYDLSGQVLVVLEGNFMEEDPTDAQMASLLTLSEALARQWGFGPATVGGHRDRAPGQTVCPGDALEARLPEVRAAVAAGARQSLAGTWALEGPDAPSLTVTVDTAGRLAGTFGGAPIRDGHVHAEGDALRFAFVTDADGHALHTHGRVVAGRLEGTSHAPSHGALTAWAARRAD